MESLLQVSMRTQTLGLEPAVSMAGESSPSKAELWA